MVLLNNDKITLGACFNLAVTKIPLNGDEIDRKKISKTTFALFDLKKFIEKEIEKKYGINKDAK